MPDTAKILPFRAREAVTVFSGDGAVARARAFLETPADERSDEYLDSHLSDGDVLTSLCAFLWDLVNTTPSDVSSNASQLHSWLRGRSEREFFFDERDYFLGESALLAAGALRLLGKREDTERWLDRADAAFRHTVAPAAHLARVSYIRLTLRYDMRRHEEVLELLPSVALTFRKLDMAGDFAKCGFLESMSLKELGKLDEAVAGLERLVSGEEYRVDPALCGMALVNLGDLYAQQGSFESALASYQRAEPLLRSAERLASLADLNLMVAVTLRRMDHLDASLDAYRKAIRGHAELGMSTREAYIRLLFAEALIEAGKPREAEWEVLAALPTIDREKMVPEGFAAVALLRDSVRQRKTDPRALFELREYLQAKN